MAKRPAPLLLSEHRSRLLELVAARTPPLVKDHESPLRVRRMAREILTKSRGVVVSSTMALSTAIGAMKDADSMEATLLQTVLRYSEQYQVPPMEVMQLIADDDFTS
jgi:hypothetical protein